MKIKKYEIEGTVEEIINVLNKWKEDKEDAMFRLELIEEYDCNEDGW